MLLLKRTYLANALRWYRVEVELVVELASNMWSSLCLTCVELVSNLCQTCVEIVSNLCRICVELKPQKAFSSNLLVRTKISACFYPANLLKREREDLYIFKKKRFFSKKSFEKNDFLNLSLKIHVWNFTTINKKTLYANWIFAKTLNWNATSSNGKR